MSSMKLQNAEVNKTWTELYGIELTNVLIEDLSYDRTSMAKGQ